MPSAFPYISQPCLDGIIDLRSSSSVSNYDRKYERRLGRGIENIVFRHCEWLFIFIIFAYRTSIHLFNKQCTWECR